MSDVLVSDGSHSSKIIDNKIPYIYDEKWRDYLIGYYEFSGYKLIKDLSIFTNKMRCIILVFKKDNKRHLFGFDDGIIFPLLSEYDITNINSDTYKKYLNTIIRDLVVKIREYYDDCIKIYGYPVYQYKLGFNLFEYLDISNCKITSINDLLYVRSDIDDLLQGLRYNVRNIIYRYGDKKIFTEKNIHIYFGTDLVEGSEELTDNIFKKFINKHRELAGRETKHERCWEITKELIMEKKAVLARYGDNFIYFLVSDEFSYYAINACDRKSDICTILIFHIYMFLKNSCNFIYMYHLNDSKSFYKKSMSNKIFTNYILEIKDNKNIVMNITPSIETSNNKPVYTKEYIEIINADSHSHTPLVWINDNSDNWYLKCCGNSNVDFSNNYTPDISVYIDVSGWQTFDLKLNYPVSQEGTQWISEVNNNGKKWTFKLGAPDDKKFILEQIVYNGPFRIWRYNQATPSEHNF